MKAMILAAGLGTRLKEFTEIVPKPMIDINGQSLLDINMKLLKRAGITDVMANLYYRSEVIIDHVKDNPLYEGFNYTVEEDLLGSAGGLRNCSKFFKGEDCFVVLSGDILTDVFLPNMIMQHSLMHKAYGTICTIGVTEVDISETAQYGVVVDDEHGKVVQFQEKPKPKDALSTLVNTGIYIFDKSIFKHIKRNKFQDFAKDVFPKLLEQDLLSAFRIGKVYWNDIGTPEKYAKAVEDVQNGRVKL